MSPEDQLEAQLQALRSDTRLVERARAGLELTPVQRLQLFVELCDLGAFFSARQPPEVLARVEASRPTLTPDAHAALARLYGRAWPA